MTSPVKLSADDLRKVRPLLVEQALRPGDVILVRGRGPRSRLIAAATGGEFSHVALWWPDQSSPGFGVLAEADGFGVGLTYLPKLEVGGQILFPLFADKARVLRHPGVAGLAPEAVTLASSGVASVDFHKPYSDLARLAEVNGLPKRLRTPARLMLSSVDALRPKLGEGGAFCSEFIGLFYARLALPIFPNDQSLQDPAKITPNDLTSRSSFLNAVDGAVLEDHMIPQDAFAWVSPDWVARYESGPLSRRHRLGQLVALAEIGRNTQRIGDEVNELTIEVFLRWQSDVHRLFLEAVEQQNALCDRLLEAYAQHDSWTIGSINRLLPVYALVLDGYLELLRVARAFYVAEGGDEHLSERFSVLNTYWTDSIVDLSHRYLRRQTLSTLRDIRSAGEGQGQIEAAQRKLLGLWVDLAQDRSDTRHSIAIAQRQLESLAHR